MTTFHFSSIFVPLVGLVFPAMASLFLYVQKNKIV